MKLFLRPPADQSKRSTVATIIVLVVAFAAVVLVWILGAVSSFAEQTALALHEGFQHPALLPWTIDGLAFALAVVALAAALDGRSAVGARVGVVITTAVSVWVNTRGVAVRAAEEEISGDAYRIAAIAPISAVIALEVLLAAIRLLVFRWRGQPPPVAIPTLRPIRLILAPWSSFRDWRREVLTVTAAHPAVAPPSDAIDPAVYFRSLEETFNLTGPPPGWDDPDDSVTPPPVDPPPAPPFPRDGDRSDDRSDDRSPDRTDRSDQEAPVTGQPEQPVTTGRPVDGIEQEQGDRFVGDGPERLEDRPVIPPPPLPPPTGRRKYTDEALATAQERYDRSMIAGHRMTDTELAPILGVSTDSARRIRRDILQPEYVKNHPPVRGVATAG